MLYQGLVHVREDYVSSVGPWVWARDDVHGWIGPKMDWEVHHSQNIEKYCSTRLGPRSVVVQAGGCMGMYPRLLSEMFNTVYTFEPDPLNFHCLVANCQRDNIVKMNAALGESSKQVGILRPESEPNNFGIRYISNSREASDRIPMITLDSLMLNRCDLLMLDMEGYEENALRGAELTINRHRPVVFVELGGRIEHFMKYLGYVPVGQSAADVIFVHGA